MFKKMMIASLATAITVQANAMTLDWTGQYRFEFNDISSTNLSDKSSGHKSYFLNHLSLSPKIIAADGMNVVAKLDLLPNKAHPNSQLGQAWGAGVNSNTASTSGQDSNSVTQQQGRTQINVSQLYLNINQEFGSILVGRAPIEFGLGITHSAGNGAFDHWSDTYDLLAYKFIVGNLSMTPMLAKVYDEDTAQGGAVSDQMFMLDYDNKDTGSQIGLFYQARTGPQSVNNFPLNSGDTITGDINIKNVNFMLGRQFDALSFKLEAGFMSGATGASNSANEGISMNGYGIAIEMKGKNADGSPGAWELRTGVTSGDDPNTADNEGFVFDRNYDIAMLMFNHPIGKYDVLKSTLHRGTKENRLAYDEEMISNVAYFSPVWNWKYSEKTTIRNTFTYAQLSSSEFAAGKADSDLGFEFDFAVVHKPSDRVQWINEVGLLFPGSAFSGPSDFDTKTTYGFSSRAAITF